MSTTGALLAAIDENVGNEVASFVFTTLRPIIIVVAVFSILIFIWQKMYSKIWLVMAVAAVLFMLTLGTNGGVIGALGQFLYERFGS